jgi:hypothetical protein
VRASHMVSFESFRRIFPTFDTAMMPFDVSPLLYFYGMSAKQSRKAIVNFLLSVCPVVRTEPIGFHLTAQIR